MGAIDKKTLAAAKAYTKQSLEGVGAVAGKNVIISSIDPIPGGNRITFSYTLDNGTPKTSTLDVMDGKDGKPGEPGADGADGVGIIGVEKTETNGIIDTYTISFSNGTTFDYEIKNGSDGKSAYEIAVDMGFDGTEDEWIESLKGEDGTDGTDGEDGRSMTSVTIDDSNNVYGTFSDGTTILLGQLNIDVSADFLTKDGFGNLRYYNGKFQCYINREWVDTAATPDNVIVVNMIPNAMKQIVGIYDVEMGKNKLMWEEPDDTVIDGQDVCNVQKVVIRRKLGSVPEDENDGILVTTVERKNFKQYKNTWFVDEEAEPSIGDVWYYKAFPKSTTGFYNYSSSNTVSILAKDWYTFGFRLDQSESDPDSMITYIEENENFRSAHMDFEQDVFDYGDWKDAWFMNVRPCVLGFNGQVVIYLNPNDYSKDLDGNDVAIDSEDLPGNVMVEFPKIYYKITVISENICEIRVCNKKLDDNYKCYSFIDKNGNEIEHCYMPAYGGSLDSQGRLRSLSGKNHSSNKYREQEIEAALANNINDDDKIWYTELFCDNQLKNILLLLIGKNTNTQVTFGTGACNSYSSSSNVGVKTTGTLNTKGLFYGDNTQKNSVKVFGMELLCGQWRACAGYVYDNGVQKVKLTHGQSDGSAVDGYNTTGEGYITIPDSTISGSSKSYISKMLLTEYGLITKATGASATTKYCDDVEFNNSGVHYALIGGDSGAKLAMGMFCVRINATTNTTFWGMGAALSCKPLALQTGGNS